MTVLAGAAQYALAIFGCSLFAGMGIYVGAYAAASLLPLNVNVLHVTRGDGGGEES